MSATEKVVNDLNVSKLMLCSPKMLTSEMCVRIGQAINGAVDLLKEREQKKLVDVNQLREKLGLAENCENCKQSEWHCQRDYYYSLKDFCEKFDIAVEELMQEGR